MKLTSKPSWPWGCRMMQKGRGLRSAATREDVYQRHAKTIWNNKKTQQFSNNFIEIDQKTHVFQHFWNSAEHWKTARAFLFAFRCGRPSKKAAARNMNGRLNFEKSWNRKRNHHLQPKTEENQIFSILSECHLRANWAVMGKPVSPGLWKGIKTHVFLYFLKGRL